MLCRCDYAERLVASFYHEIKSEYYGGHRSVSIKGIVLEYFSALTQTEINSSKKSCPRHAEFHSFLSDDSKQYASTNTAHCKSFIKILKEKKTLTSTLSTIYTTT